MIARTQTSTPTRFAKLGALAVAAALTLTACGGGGAQTETTLSMEQGGVKTTMTYFAEGDTVVKQTTENTLNYESAGFGDRETAEEQVGQLSEQFEGIAGLNHSVEYKKNELVETLTVDYTKADIAEVSQLTGSTFDGDAKNAEKVSLKQSVDALKELGFTEVK